jgi:hypothetical protein
MIMMDLAFRVTITRLLCISICVLDCGCSHGSKRDANALLQFVGLMFVVYFVIGIMVGGTAKESAKMGLEFLTPLFFFLIVIAFLALVRGCF